MLQQSTKAPHKRIHKVLTIARDQAWQFLFGLLSFIVAAISLYVAVVPQAAPIRAAIVQTLSPSKAQSGVGGTPISSGPFSTLPATAPSGGLSYNNKQLTCTARPCPDDLQWFLNSSAVNATKKIVSLNFTIVNSSMGTTYDNQDIAGDSGTLTLYSKLDTSPYPGYVAGAGINGEDAEGIPFDVAPGTQTQVSVKFGFDPYLNTIYRLDITIDSMNQYNIPAFSLDPVSMPL